MLTPSLNLLPPQTKTKLERLINLMFAKKLLELLTLLAIIGGVILIIAWMRLVERFYFLTESTDSRGSSYASYNQNIRKTNHILREIKSSSQTFFPITPLITSLSTGLPAGIKITNLDINRISGKISISGVAKTRLDLLNYQEALNSLDWLAPAVMPSAQLIIKENINFTYNTLLKKIPLVTSPNETSQ